jgi:hypothetical protein
MDATVEWPHFAHGADVGVRGFGGTARAADLNQGVSAWSFR